MQTSGLKYSKITKLANPNKIANTPFKFISKTRIKCPYKIKVENVV